MNFGKPVPQLNVKEIVMDDDAWAISDETIKEIERISEANMNALKTFKDVVFR